MSSVHGKAISWWTIFDQTAGEVTLVPALLLGKVLREGALRAAIDALIRRWSLYWPPEITRRSTGATRSCAHKGNNAYGADGAYAPCTDSNPAATDSAARWLESEFDARPLVAGKIRGRGPWATSYFSANIFHIVIARMPQRIFPQGENENGEALRSKTKA